MLHATVGIQHDVPRRVIHQSDWEPHPQLPTAGLGELTAAQPGADEVQLSFAHRAFEAEQQAVVELGGVIEAVLVADQRAAQPADLQQAVPVGVVAREPRDLETEHDPGAADTNLGDESLKPLTVRRRGARLALV